ncbi:MAG: methyl-accepting chemotaxis protein [Lamprobacter sp.]|uniref:methyl-accepting chemotaxis protein n=1 Tax=Lamprobacter sp. TaxID=3100796 RepID=UPI002B262468|nr:methyl-accepting chemotaxis protein [Lamprobacter sp.]MEA3639768.1 methyl-accepting chemotaxis protein [Lamprobacter sp.]
MTMRTSWTLVLAAFLSLIAVLSLILLFVLDQAASTIGLLAPQAGDVGIQSQRTFAALAGNLRLLVGAVLTLALLVAAIALWGVTANVLRPLQKVVAGFDAMAYGDLSVPLERFGRNELGQLSAAVRGLQQRLSQTVALVRISSDAVHRGAKHIAIGNNDFSTRTQQQAAKLKQTASQIAALTASVRQHAEHARQARHVTESAARTASTSSETVGELVSIMNEVSQGVQRMREAVKLIDTIAAQANRVALLASVEAAQAGDGGHGFGVIAGEVRGLSKRSADTAQAIRSLIEASTTGVNAGLEQAGRAGRSIDETVCAVQQVNSLMDGITSGSRDQSQGIEKIKRAIAHMDQFTQHNADLVRQDAKAADQVEAEADRLKKAVSVFRLAPEVEEGFAANRYDEAAEWMQTLTPDDLDSAFRRKAKRRRAA